jgi:hypothetical protein
MNRLATLDADLLQRLPLPLAQLYRRAYNARTPLQRHLTAFRLWEASARSGFRDSNPATNLWHSAGVRVARTLR